MSIWFAFTAGFLSFASACVLPLIPSYIAVITGLSVTELESNRVERFKIMPRTIAFIIGLIIPLMLIGMGATVVGDLFTPATATFLSQFFGFIVIVFGLHLLGLLKFQVFQKDIRFHRLFQKKGGVISVGLIGMAFGFGWTPCIGPMLSTILILAADSSTVWQGAGLLAVYGLGLGIPFLLIALVSSSSLKVLKFLQRHVRVLSIISGILLVLFGILLVTGNMAYITPSL
ncbi:cytochrome c biogenesis protein CcdA [Bacillus shivajii]|uniref:cytochrome c biogenesis CcdA family protein n=1 Tax=Bacillus shivajii TaxID=1983719 RepID=UPI001CF97F5E|nr:cytochrome c biogenesis protein CcdA [Bacillus shivajii]UCZ52038.1 cytochrome c biogenesis protein CcdA [Bacillus shivajii]